VADAIFGDSAGRDYYGRLLRTLEEVGGYRRRTPGEAIDARERNYYVYPYDWRGDNVDAIRGLHELVERIRFDYQDPELTVDVVAHSNGGLLARYYARYGTAPPGADCAPPLPTCAGSRAIRRLVLIGTPNLGTIQAALSHVRGEEVGLARIEQEVVATCAGVAQMLPHEDLTWLLDVRGEAIERSVFAIETWRELGLSVFDPVVRARVVARRGRSAGGAHMVLLERYFARSLERGRAFSRALSAPAPADDVAPFVFGADCEPTLARLVVERERGRTLAHETPKGIGSAMPHVDYAALMFQPGDRVVTRQSLLGRCRSVDGVTCKGPPDLRIEHSVFLCGEHQSLTGNASFQNNLLYTLLSA
jgi:pimeloyl-ACP methyl ester carboxylesterase